MGKVLLVCRLAVKDLRRRPAQAILLLLAIAAGATTLALGLALQGTTNNPNARTRAATNGPDVIATVFPDGSSGSGPETARPGGSGGPSGSGSADVGGLVPLEHASGVAAHSGPFPVTWTLLRAGHTTGGAEVEGRSTAPSSVDRPKLLEGTWVRTGGVVVEAAFANALGLHVGDRLSLGGSSFGVTGTAVTAAIPDYPDTCSHPGCFLAGSISSSNPGLVWATEADAEHIARVALATPVAYFLNLKLNDPAGASAFADRYNANAAPTAPFLYSWQSIRDGDAQVIAEVQLVLITGSWLLALLALASVVVLLGARLAVRRPRRLLLSVFSVAVTASGLVAVLILHATATTGSRSLGPKLGEVTTIISVMLVVLAAVNAVFIAWTTALEARHSAALARALGATPAQITTGLSVAQLLPALAGTLLGIPGGIGIYDASKNGGGATTIPSALWLVVMVVVTLLAVAVLTAIPVRIGARRPVAEVLQAEAA